ncbi:Protein NRT1/ PTR FAMILY 2.8 [Linum perenne]
MNLCVLAFLFGALGLLSIGADRIRPCKIAFDADQFDTSPPKGLSQLECFFNWWYFRFSVPIAAAVTAN